MAQFNVSGGSGYVRTYRKVTVTFDQITAAETNTEDVDCAGASSAWVQFRASSCTGTAACRVRSQMNFSSGQVGSAQAHSAGNMTSSSLVRNVDCPVAGDKLRMEIVTTGASVDVTPSVDVYLFGT